MTKEEYAQLNYLLSKLEYEYLDEAINSTLEEAKYYNEILEKIKNAKNIIPPKMWKK